MAKRKKGWMVVLRPDVDAKADGVEDECFTVIYTKLSRAKEECSKYLKDRAQGEGAYTEIDDFEIDWMKDSSSTPDLEVWFGRPRDSIEDSFYLHEVKIEL